MRARFLLPLLTFALIASACGDDDPTIGGDGVVLRYAYAPGDELSYDVDQQMSMSMTGTGDMAMAGALDATMDMDLMLQIDYSVAEGPDPETVAITMVTKVVGGSGSMESMGQTQEIPFQELAAQGTTDVTVILDAQGSPISIDVGGQSLPTDLFGDLQGATGLGELASPQHMGPQFPEEPIAVGSTWETSSDASTFGLEISSRAEHEVVAMEDVAGRSTYRIESIMTTDGFTINLQDIMEALLESGADLGGDAAEMEAAIAMFDTMGIEAEYRIGDMELTMTSWFDPVDGIVVRAETSMPMTMDVEMSGMPDVGDLAMSMDMDIAQTMQLVEG